MWQLDMKWRPLSYGGGWAPVRSADQVGARGQLFAVHVFVAATFPCGAAGTRRGSRALDALAGVRWVRSAERGVACDGRVCCVSRRGEGKDR